MLEMTKMSIKITVIFSVAFAATTAVYASDQFPNGSCEGPNRGGAPSIVTGCGHAGDTGFYVAPNADMFAADLSGMDLTGAKLMDVNFWDATLKNVKLANADLSRGNFYNADLTGADLAGCSLSNANMWGANLTGANLENANLDGVFGNNNTICPNGQPRSNENSNCGF